MTKMKKSSVLVDKAMLYNNPNIPEELKTALTLLGPVPKMKKFKIVLWLIAAGRNGLNLDEVCDLTGKGYNITKRWIEELIEEDVLTQFQATVQGVRYTLLQDREKKSIPFSLSPLTLPSSPFSPFPKKSEFGSGEEKRREEKNSSGAHAKGSPRQKLGQLRERQEPLPSTNSDGKDQGEGIGEGEGNLQARNYVPGLGGRSKPSPRVKLKVSVSGSRDSLGYRPNPRSTTSGLAWQKKKVADWLGTDWVEYWAWKFRKAYGGVDDPFVVGQHHGIIQDLGIGIIKFAKGQDWDSAKLREYIDWAFDYAQDQPWMTSPISVQMLVKEGGHIHSKFLLSGVKAKRRRVRPTESWHPAGVVPRPRRTKR